MRAWSVRFWTGRPALVLALSKCQAHPALLALEGRETLAQQPALVLLPDSGKINKLVDEQR